MDALLKKQGTSLRKYMKNPKEIKCTGNVIGIGPNGEMEELIVRGTHCVGKKLHASLLDPSKKNCQNLFAKFASDYNQMSQLNHPNIANFLGLGLIENMQCSSSCLVIIREYVKDNLAHLLETTPCIPLAIKTSILLDITKALEYLHSSNPSIVHRNLTSNNVLITGSMQAKVADMECFCFINSSRQLEVKKLVFMPPETRRDNPKYETSSDMFSFGHIALHTAIHMFPGDLSEAHNEVERRSKYIAHLKDPQGIDTILLKLIINCLNDSPKKRPTANAAMRELEQLEQKLTCKGDKYHAIMKEMNMYEMAERLIESQEDSDPQCSEDTVPIDDLAAAKRRSMFLVTAQVKEGQPSVLYVHETVGGIFSKHSKWMEYKFKISRSGSGEALEYRRLNDDKAIGSISLEAVVAVIARMRVGNETVFPFYVHFRSGQWILGAHSEDERRIWMEAILPGSTRNQWADDFIPSSASSMYRQRSATSPDFRESHDPAYIKYNEILGPSNRPPPIPERPEIDEVTEGLPDNTYLTILPPDTDENKRTKALARIKSLTTEQIDTMLQMFEHDVKPPSLDDTASPSKKPNKETIFQPQPETQPTPPITDHPSDLDNINEHSSKHPSKGLYFAFSDLESSEETTSTLQEVSDSSAANGDRSVKRPSLPLAAEMPVSPRRQLGRHNALRRQQALRRSSEGEKQSHPVHEKTKQGPSGTDTTNRLRKLLKQQSSEDMLEEGSGNPDWSRARLKDSDQQEMDVEPETALSPEDTLCKGLSIPASNLHDLNKIAIGHYGPIFKATMVDPAKPDIVTVAVKSFQSQFRERNHSFLQDLAVMVASRYQNVARLYGIVHENNWLVMEYASLGDLKQFLLRNKVSVNHLEKYMLDISMGMYYLSSRGLVHRNLALRNILIGEDETCKIADLGMRHSLENGIPPQVSHSTQELTPAVDQRRWMSPENLTKGLFSEASDVWSFGVVQWEMFQPMRVPYAAIDCNQLLNHIMKGHTLEVPDVSSEIVVKIMRACWHWNATKRPSFMYITSLLMKRTLGE